MLFHHPLIVSCIYRLTELLTDCCVFHGLGPLACFETELTSETMDPSRHFGRTPWMGHRPVARPLPI
jgi:hypothetical protein